MDCFLYTAWMTWEFIGELLVIHQLSLGLSLGLNTPLPHPDQRVHRGLVVIHQLTVGWRYGLEQARLGHPDQRESPGAAASTSCRGLVVGLEHPSPARRTSA